MIENVQMVVLLGGVFVSVWIASALYRRGMTAWSVWFGLLATIALSLLMTRWPSRARQLRADLWVPPPILIPAWLCFLSYAWVRALDRWWHESDDVHVTVSRLQESAELILYAGALAFLVIVLLRVRAGKSPSLGPNRSL